MKRMASGRRTAVVRLKPDATWHHPPEGGRHMAPGTWAPGIWHLGTHPLGTLGSPGTLGTYFVAPHSGGFWSSKCRTKKSKRLRSP